MEVSRIIELLMHGNQLKRTARTGWGQRGVPLPENVAAHSYGVAYVALILAQLSERELDLAAVLAMAILHDLPEGTTTDIPPAVWRYLPKGAKASAEWQVMEQIAGGTPLEPRVMGWWGELRQNESAEAQLVHDADKLDQYLQALVYEQQTGNRQLAEFWQRPYRFHFPEAQAIYDEIERRRTTAPRV